MPANELLKRLSLLLMAHFSPVSVDFGGSKHYRMAAYWKTYPYYTVRDIKPSNDAATNDCKMLNETLMECFMTITQLNTDLETAKTVIKQLQQERIKGAVYYNNDCDHKWEQIEETGDYRVDVCMNCSLERSIDFHNGSIEYVPNREEF